MAKPRTPTPMRAAIIKHATELIFEQGFAKATPKAICEKVDIGLGNLTYHFPTKEHLLAVLVQMMIDYQWQEMENAADEGKSSLLAYCLELTTLVAIGEQVPQMQEFFVAAYTHPMTLDLIRANDIEKIKTVFAEYTEGWDDEKFAEIEAVISGIEYATIMKTEHSASIERRIEGGINSILLLFGIPEELRKKKITKLLAMDYRTIGMDVYQKFKAQVTKQNEDTLDEILSHTKVRTWK